MGHSGPNKLSNEYADVIPERLYADMPKTVVAAIAVSALSCGGDRLDEARQAIVTEWYLLHLNGIVPQPVPAKWHYLIDDKHSPTGRI